MRRIGVLICLNYRHLQCRITPFFSGGPQLHCNPQRSPAPTLGNESRRIRISYLTAPLPIPRPECCRTRRSLVLHAADPKFCAVFEVQDAFSTAALERTVFGPLPGSSNSCHQDAYLSATRPGPQSGTTNNVLHLATAHNIGYI